jgi:biotin transport system substrate-specific component
VEKSKKLAYAGFIAALMVVASFIRIPLLIVPITLQVLVVIICPVVFGIMPSFMGFFIYILTGIIGLPVFAGGGGPAYVLNPTFGYIIGFLFASLPIGYISKKYDNVAGYIVAGLSGILVIYFFGVLYLYLNINYIQGKDMSLLVAIKTGFLITITIDLLKLAIAIYVIVRLKKTLNI